MESALRARQSAIRHGRADQELAQEWNDADDDEAALAYESDNDVNTDDAFELKL